MTVFWGGVEGYAPLPIGIATFPDKWYNLRGLFICQSLGVNPRRMIKILGEGDLKC
jgi:hypothetical protein